MMQRPQWALVAFALLSLLALAGWLGWRWVDSESGPAEAIYSRVQVGMTREQAVAVLLDHDNSIDTLWLEWTTRDGKSVGQYLIGDDSYDRLPPPDEVVSWAVRFSDRQGRDVDIAFGPDGRVVDTRLTPGVLEGRLEIASRAICGGFNDLASAEWWGQQPRKLHRSLCRRPWPYLACGAVVVLLALWWALRRRLRDDQPNERHAVTSGSAALPGFLATSRSSINS